MGLHELSLIRRFSLGWVLLITGLATSVEYLYPFSRVTIYQDNSEPFLCPHYFLSKAFPPVMVAPLKLTRDVITKWRGPLYSYTNPYQGQTALHISYEGQTGKERPVWLEAHHEAGERLGFTLNSNSSSLVNGKNAEQSGIICPHWHLVLKKLH